MKNKPLIICRSKEEFETITNLYENLNEKIKTKVTEMIFQGRPFIHHFKTDFQDFKDRLSIDMIENPNNVTVVKNGWRIEYDSFFFSGDLKENQSVEFHFIIN